MFRDPKSDETIIIQEDSREGNFALKHSIMDCIEKLAAVELERRNSVRDGQPEMVGVDENYLCLNYHVYTTHEPCSMCTMALIHSRIGKLTYINSLPITGSVSEKSGQKHGFEKFSGLNWKFDCWHWCGEDLGVPDLDNELIFA